MHDGFMFNHFILVLHKLEGTSDHCNLRGSGFGHTGSRICLAKFLAIFVGSAECLLQHLNNICSLKEGARGYSLQKEQGQGYRGRTLLKKDLKLGLDNYRLSYS